MAAELGVAYLSLAISSKGVGKDVRAALGDIETGADQSGKKAGGLLGGGLKKGLGLGIKAVAGIGLAVAGLAAKGGVSRALAIEGAQKKLEGLGHSSKSITAIMENALASVKGTAFGLGDAATVAASLTASGVKSGKQLEGVLKTVADTAQISGRSLTDIGAIFGSVAARGKLQGDDMLQLMSSGVPVLQFLAKQTGKTTAEVSKMVSQGKIDFATFAAAMQAGLGGAALKGGETFKGALSNVYAALGRLGALVATPALASLKTIFNAATPAVDALTAKLKPFAEALGPKLEAATKTGVVAVSGLTSLLVKGDFTKALREAFGWEEDAPIVDAILQIRTNLADLGTSAATLLSPIKDAFSQLGQGLNAGSMMSGAAQMVAALSPLSIALKALAPVLPQLGVAVAQVVVALLPAVPAITQVASVIAVTLAQALSAVTPALVALVVPIAQLIGKLASFTPVVMAAVAAFAAFQVVQTVVAGITAFQTAMTGVRAALAGTTAAQWLLNAAMTANPIGAVIVAVAALAAGLTYFFTQTETGRAAWEGFTTWLAGAWTALATVASVAWNAISSGALNVLSTLSSMWATIGPIITAPLQAAAAVFTAIWESLKVVVAGVFLAIVGIVTGNGGLIVSAISGVGSALSSIWSGLWSRMQGILSGAMASIVSIATAAWGRFVGAVQSAITRVVSAVAALPGRVVGILSSLGGMLVSVGQNMIQGLVSGIQAMAGRVADAARSVVMGAINAAKSALQIQSPSKVFRGIGKQVTAGLALGITSKASAASSAISKVVAAVVKAANAAPKKLRTAAKKTAKAVEKMLTPQKTAHASWWKSASAANKTTNQMLKSLSSSGKWTKAATASMKKSTLADFAKARETVAGRIKDATKELQRRVDESNQLRDKVASSITGEMDLANAATEVTYTKHSDAKGNTWYTKSQAGFAGIAAHVKALAAKARTFAGKLKDLIKAGFPAGLVQEVAGMGTEAGISVATALLGASKAEQGDLIKDYTSLTKAAGQAGQYVADQMYKAGIDAQNGIVKGLLADDAKLAKAAKSLADKLTKAVKKALGIKSPSTVFRDEIGMMVAAGAAEGIGRGQHLVDAAGAAMLDPALSRSDWRPADVGDVYHFGSTSFHESDLSSSEKQSIETLKSLLMNGRRMARAGV